jgi:hypothetical protein
MEIPMIEAHKNGIRRDIEVNVLSEDGFHNQYTRHEEV